MDSTVTLLGDAPLEALVSEDDRLPVAGTLLRALHSLDPASCIAVYGPWGSGKTSLLRGVYHAWSEGPKVWFDPWLYERRDDVLTPLVACTVKQLEDRLKGGDRLKEIKRLGLAVAKTTLSLVARFGVGFAFGGALGKELEGLKSLTTLKAEDVERYFEKVREFYDEVEEVRRNFWKLVDRAVEPGERLVVFLDDLDRCQPDVALGLIEGVKLLLCGLPGVGPGDDAGRPPVQFVFALDRQIVGEAIRQKFPGSSLYTGESYLEKIFDLSLEVPRASDGDRWQMLRRAFDVKAVEQLPRALRNAFGDVDEVVLKTLAPEIFGNPRALKRTINRLLLLVETGEWEMFIRDDRAKAGDVKRKIVMLVAGAERFRTFRHFVYSATDEEVAVLIRTAHGQATTTVREAGAVGAIAATPGLAQYLTALGLTVPHADTADKVRKLVRPNKAAHIPLNLGDIDALLRSVGL